MADLRRLRDDISQKWGVKSNGSQAITGDKLKGAMLEVIDTLNDVKSDQDYVNEWKDHVNDDMEHKADQVYVVAELAKKADAQKLSELEGYTTGLIVDDEENDFSIEDEDGNTILSVNGGHLQTEAFDSADMKTVVEDSNATFEITDEEGIAVMQIVDGHIRTRDFNSADIKENARKHIYVVGDSIMQGQTGPKSLADQTLADNSVPSFLQEMLGDDYVVHNLGCGGENSADIAIRMGWASGVIKKSFVLKGDGSETMIFDSRNNPVSAGSSLEADIVDSVNGLYISGSAQGRTEGNATKDTGWINGIPVIFRRTSNADETGIGSGTYSAIYVKRKDAVSYDLTITEGSSIVLAGSALDGIFVVMSGTNNPNYYTGENYDDMLRSIFMKSSKVIMLGLNTGVYEHLSIPFYRDANSVMLKRCGDRFIDVMAYLSSRQSFYDNGITPTTDSMLTQTQLSSQSSTSKTSRVYSDVFLMDKGLMPMSYWRYAATPQNPTLVDAVHLNGMGYRSISRLINNKIKQLNW